MRSSLWCLGAQTLHQAFGQIKMTPKTNYKEYINEKNTQNKHPNNGNRKATTPRARKRMGWKGVRFYQKSPQHHLFSQE